MSPVNDPPRLGEMVCQCRDDVEFLPSLVELYGRVDTHVAQESPRCMGGGACCHFDLMDHRAYLSCGELALLIQQPPGRHRRVQEGRCPYQSGPRCLARERRPLACRIFFCDKRIADFCHAAYEQFHSELRALHQKCGLPYSYVELVSGVMQSLIL